MDVKLCFAPNITKINLALGELPSKFTEESKRDEIYVLVLKLCIHCNTHITLNYNLSVVLKNKIHYC